MMQTKQKKKLKFDTLIQSSDFLRDVITDTHAKLGSLLSRENIEKWLLDEAVIFNMHIYTHNTNHTGKIEIELEMLYGMQGQTKNAEMFLHFCSIHGLTPRINDITINGERLGKHRDLHSLIFFLLKEKDLLFSQDILNDVEKLQPETLEKFGYETIREILQTIIVFSRYNQSEYRKIYGPKNQKLKMTNTFAENIFLEIAMEMEKQVRRKLDIKSTYMHLATFDEDMFFKTDMKFLFRKDENDDYIPYPIQFTLGRENSHNMQKKERKIEKFLYARIAKKDIGYKDFIVLGVNGNFTEYITSNTVKNEYQIWRKNPEKRTYNSRKPFPYFMENLKQEKLIAAQAMYVVLNKIYSEFDFNQDDEHTEKVRKKIPFGQKDTDKRIVNNVELEHIAIFTKYRMIKMQFRYEERYMTKWRFSVNYKGKHIGRISIYRNPKKR